VFLSGCTTAVKAPPEVVCAVLTFVAAVCPQGLASTSTFSPTFWFESVPARVTLAP
jgi:hypothetical protein